MEKQVRVAVVQAMPILFNKEKCIEKVEELTQEAASNGAKVILFPESFIPGYPQVFDYTAKVQRPDKHQQLMQLYYENAITDSGAEAKRLSSIAEQNQVFLLVGVTEKVGEKLFSSIFYFDPSGSYLGKDRMLRTSGFERKLWHVGEEYELNMVDSPYGKIGSAICWENYQLLLRFSLYVRETCLYLAPTADSHPSWQNSIQQAALEGRCFVLSAAHYLPFSMVPAELKLSAEPGYDKAKYRGGSAIINPFGEYLAGPLYDREGILYADLNLDQYNKKPYDFNRVVPGDTPENG